MPNTLEVLFTPAEFSALSGRDLSQTVCVVFDVLRATSTIVSALANGAAAVMPVEEIEDALSVKKKHPLVLLAGERNGLRIRSDQTGGIDFDFGNSPREFNGDRIAGKTIVITTTNGSRALRACARAQTVLAGAFLNLRSTADYVRHISPKNLLLVCSGTQAEAAYEDVLGAGALVEMLWPEFGQEAVADSAVIALQIYQESTRDLAAALKYSRNARRLMSMPELSADVAWCFQRDIYHFIAAIKDNAIIKLQGL